MDISQVRPQVARLFPAGGPRRTRVAVEHELLTADHVTGAVAPIGLVSRATRHASYAGHLGFEPGGQVELSLPCAADAVSLGARLRAEVTALRADCAAVGVRLDAAPVDPRPESEVPLQRATPRYLAMQRHFDTIGPSGRRMMRRTASTQVCLDWWPGAAGLEQWRLLHLAGPGLAAAYARSTGTGSRLATWLAVDPGRTTFDDRLLRAEDPIAAYADFAAAARVFTAPGDVAQHLSTLFPAVRPRGRYLEVRFLDVQPLRAVPALVSVLATLLYDDDCRRAAAGLVAGREARLAEDWLGAASGAPEVRERGLALVGLAVAAARRRRPATSPALGGAA